MSSYKPLQNLVVREFSNEKVQKSYEEATREGLWKSEEKLFKKYFKPGSRIFDIGCGSGRTTFSLVKIGYKVIGIDLTPAMIKTAKRLSKEFRIKIDFRVGNAANLKIRNESFDNALFSFNGWDQIPGEENRLKALKEANRAIKPGGYFIFTSHLRQLNKKYFWFWIKQWLRLYIFKPIGLNIREIEYGDQFFKRARIEEYENEQFIHIPRLSKIIKQIKKAGFELVFYDKRNSIAKEDEKLITGNCTFFVCKKPILC
ncbi:MAG: methyltransferase domain-containing protein [Candidatus Woesearchaeota archaeon]|nr:methyltransferase domain-containing protein [Candidatus Woesearchaeota archaeon]